MIFPNLSLQGADRLLQIWTVVDVNMADGWVFVFENLDYRFEQLVDSFPNRSDSWNNRNTQHATQMAIVELCPGTFQFVVHVQCNDHFDVHVDQLGGQVEVAFKVGCINDIDDHIGHLLQNVCTYV